MGLIEYIISIYNSIKIVIEELKKDSTNYLHNYLGIDE